MPVYNVKIVNEHFSQEAEQTSPDVIKAWQTALSSAIAIGGEQVSHGSPFFGAEVTLDEDGKRLGRYVVTVGATILTD